MPYTIPNEAAAGFADQAEPDQVDFDIITAGLSHGAAGTGFGTGPTGVQSGCAVTAQGTPDMTVAVAAGVVRIGGRRVTVAGGNVTITTASGSNPRFDLIVVDTAGTKTAIAGTAAANPIFPAITTGKVVLASVYVPTSDTAINTNQITDKRVFVKDPDVENVRWYGATGDGSTDDGQAFADCYAAAQATTVSSGRTPIIFVPDGRYKLDSTNGWSLDRRYPVHVKGALNPLHYGNNATTWDIQGSVLFRSGSNYTFPGAPTAVITGAQGAAGNVDVGTHYYSATVVSGANESDLGPVSAAIVVTTSAKQVDLTVPASSTGTTRKVYRTTIAQNELDLPKLVGTIADATTTAFTDNVADVSLGANAPWDGSGINNRAIVNFTTPGTLVNGRGPKFEDIIFELQDPTGGSALPGPTAAVAVMGVFHTYEHLTFWSKNASAVGLYLTSSWPNTLIDDNSYHTVRRCASYGCGQVYSSHHGSDAHNSITIEQNFAHKSNTPASTRPAWELGMFVNARVMLNRVEHASGTSGYTTTQPVFRWLRGWANVSIGNGGEPSDAGANCYFHYFGRGTKQFLVADVGAESADAHETGARLAYIDSTAAGGHLILNNREGTTANDYVTGVEDGAGGAGSNWWLNNSLASGSFMRLPLIREGNGSPEGVQTANPGAFYAQRDAANAADSFWVKSSGTGNTGWRRLLFSIRSVLLDSSIMRMDAAVGVRLGTPPNVVDAISLVNGVTSGAYINTLMPVDATTGTITVRPIWVPSATDGTAHTVRWEMAIKILTGADVTAAGTSVAWTGASAARTANVQVVEPGQASTAVTPAAGEHVRLEVRRIGGDAADTYVGDVQLLGVQIDYGSYS